VAGGKWDAAAIAKTTAGDTLVAKSAAWTTFEVAEPLTGDRVQGSLF
jgi:hypothetical protein